ncbi:DUF4419 domain-containing protein [Patescibacteria group bacterium]
MTDSVLRTFTPEIRRYGKVVRPKDTPSARIGVNDYLGAVLPGRRVIKTGREEMIRIYRRPQPTSLFFQAVHKCFRDHHPLALRPEVLMHIIVNEVATTVNLHPDDYRHLFTTAEEGKTRIDTGVSPWDDNGWRDNLDEYGEKLREAVPAGIMEHLLPEFSTHTPESRAASMVAFMDAAKEFYDYHSHTRCGIPEIRLLGTVEDYYMLLHAAQSLSERFEKHLGEYFRHLLPVLKTIATQAAGDEPDDGFWKSIYKHYSGSGTDTLNGWITTFVNYVQTAPSSYRGTAGELTVKKAVAYDWEQNCETDEHNMKGIELGSVPSQVSTAPFTWHHLDGTESKMLFAGGVLGVDELDGAMMPVLSYAVIKQAE